MVNCKKYFKEIVTEEGVCFTFNTIKVDEIFRIEVMADDMSNLLENADNNATNWSLETGYKTDDIEVYPQRVISAGARGGLNIVLQSSKPDLDYICHGPVQGFKFFLHSPGEFPSMSKQYFRIASKQELLVKVKPSTTKTSEGLKRFSPQKRQCYFNDERNLRLFKSYTQNNCEMECLANFTRASCGCVKFSMPRDNDTQICTQKDVKCYNDAEDNYLRQQTKDSLESGGSRSNCNCLPSCTSITYDAELSQAEFDYFNLFKSFKDNIEQFDTLELARLTIFFKEAEFLSLQQSEENAKDWTFFIANCGGILAFFMGFSILSLIEIFYHATLRLACN